MSYYEFIGSKKSKKIHRVINDGGNRYWREQCSAEEEDVFATEAEAEEAVQKLGWRRCRTCWDSVEEVTIGADEVGNLSDVTGEPE